MDPIVKQLRAAFNAGISRNPTQAKYFLGNALVGEVVRLCHESASVPTNKTTPVGFGTSFSMFVELKHDTRAAENTTLIADGIGWKLVSKPDQLKYAGKVYGVRAPLVKVDTLSDAKLITSFKIGAAVGVIAGVAITVTLPRGTDVSALTPVVTHTGKMIDKTAAQNFSAPVEYTITAENLTTKKYTVTVVLS